MTDIELALADELLTQGLSYWAQYQASKTAGTLTVDDMAAAAKKLDVDIDQLAADIAARG